MRASSLSGVASMWSTVTPGNLFIKACGITSMALADNGAYSVTFPPSFLALSWSSAIESVAAGLAAEKPAEKDQRQRTVKSLKPCDRNNIGSCGLLLSRIVKKIY